MKVKKFLSILLCLVAMAAAQAQLEEYSISDIAEATNAQLPMKMTTGITLTHVSVEDGQMVYLISADEKYLTVESACNNKAEIKQNAISMLIGNSQSEMLIDMLISQDYGLTYKYVGASTGNTCVIEISPSELRRLADDPALQRTPRQQLEFFAEQSQANIPLKVNDYITISSLYLTDRNLVYVYTIDDTFSLKVIRQNMEQSREALIQQMKSSPAEAVMLSALKECRMGISFVFARASGNEQEEMTITHKEL